MRAELARHGERALAGAHHLCLAVDDEFLARVAGVGRVRAGREHEDHQRHDAGDLVLGKLVSAATLHGRLHGALVPVGIMRHRALRCA